MPDSYVLIVEKAITELLKSQLNETALVNIDGNAFRGRTRMGSREPLPMLSLVQAPEVEINFEAVGDGTQRQHQALYLLQGWIEDDTENPTDPAHLFLAETKRVLALILDEDSDYHMLQHVHPDKEPIISGLDIAFGLVRPPEQTISDKAYFWLPIRIGFVEDLTAPYDLP